MTDAKINHSKRLEGKVAIVIGASRGIGAASALLFAREGACVVLAARSQADIDKIAQEIKGEGGNALAVPTDVSQAEAVERLVQLAVATFGRLDAAFNNAGEGYRPIPLAEMTPADFDKSIRLNLGGTFLSMRYEIPAMLAGGGGAIVNMSSTGGLQGVFGISAYSAAKHGVIGLTKSAALDYGAQNLRVNALAPGPILNERMSMVSDEMRQLVINAVPMRRIGMPEEVAEAAA